MKSSFLIAVYFALVLSLALATSETSEHAHKHKHKHHKGHHHHHHHHHKHHNATAPAATHASLHAAAKPAVAQAAPASVKTVAAQTQAKTAHKSGLDEKLVAKMKALESRLAAKKEAQEKGHLLVMGPLGASFSKRFSEAVAKATGADAGKVKVTLTTKSKDQPNVFAVDFRADPRTVKAVESQAGDPDSKLAEGDLHSFLVSKDDDGDESKKPSESEEKAPDSDEKKSSGSSDGIRATPVQEKGLDIDTQMPYGELEPFGREDTAQELTEDSISESNEMVDQLERAEVAEEKRAVFRALTRLRGAAITSFDGVARSQTGNIDEYNQVHKWRKTHPLHHLADEESDITKWAFPDNADF